METEAAATIAAGALPLEVCPSARSVCPFLGDPVLHSLCAWEGAPSSGAAAALGSGHSSVGRWPQQRPAPGAAGRVAVVLPLQVSEGGRAALTAAGRGAQHRGTRTGL